MVRLLVKIILLSFSYASGYGGFNLSSDIDIRYNLYEWEENKPEITLIGLSLRKIFSDSKGDRLNFFFSYEIEDNFSEFMIHELYVNYKGPMGLWNISVGRRNIPYGLLYSFDPSRYLYHSPHPILTFESDDGIMISGNVKGLEYSFSTTLGHGHPNSFKIDYPKLLTGRTGLTFGSTDENNIGISFIYGRLQQLNEGVIAYTNKKAIGIDLTIYYANLIGRIETNTGFIDKNTFGSIALITDIALSSKIDLTTVFKIMREKGIYKDDMLFFGLSFTHGSLKIRGGYSYAFFKKPSHTLSLQLYYIYTFTI